MLLRLPAVLSAFFIIDGVNFLLSIYFPTVTSSKRRHPHLLFGLDFVLSTGLTPIILTGVWPFSAVFHSQTDFGLQQWQRVDIISVERFIRHLKAK